MSHAKVPVAILGYGCRFPGGISNGPGFWELLCSGRDAIGEVPPDRWSQEAYYSERPGVIGKSVSRWGGFLDQIDQFEPECFGMSPREAAFVDPQQRLLLETTWEALEHAGLSISGIAGSRTGVFVGISNVDYGHIQSLPTHHRGLGAFTATGSSASIAANRISYCLDLRGPSLSVDTACSSSLVALDVAVKSLCVGQVDAAIVGGVNVIITPETFIMFSSASMLSPDGRCKAFDASANGFVRAEGAGIVVLKRLEDALRDRDPVRAVIVASGANQDGRTSGISLPNIDAQELLLREVYRDADVALANVGYVEAHGTGTQAGDPAEAEALGRVFAASHGNGSHLVIGSVKTNIGHLESGSGIASLIKVILMLEHRQIPPSLHFHTPNPAISFELLRLRVPTKLEPWPDDRPAVVGINSFGFGGANAHAVLTEFRPEEPTNGRHQKHALATQTDAKRGELYPILLTARSPDALRTLADSWVNFLSEAEASGAALSDIACSALARRSHYRHRLGFAAAGFADAREAVRSYVTGDTRPGSYSAEAGRVRPQIAFVFCGQGAHWRGMGRELLRSERVFREIIERCDAAFHPITGWSVVDALQDEGENGRLDRTSFAQPLLFAVQVALVGLWRSWGINPDAVVGHSVGELAAAYASGAMSFETTAGIVAKRGMCLEEHARPGQMAAAAISESEACELLTGFSDQVSVAAVNSPRMVTLAGDALVLARLGDTLNERNIWWKPLEVQLAFHTALVDSAGKPFLDAIGDVHSHGFAVPMISTITGKSVDAGGLTAAYWWDNMRRPVRFAEAIQELLNRGVQIFLEVGPHPVLGGAIKQCNQQSSPLPVVLPSLRRRESERRVMVSSLAGLYAHGVEADPNSFWPQFGKFVELPAHPWRRQRYWHECLEARNARLASQYHPLLGRCALDATGTWETALDKTDLSWLRDHAVGDQVVFPAAGFVEMALAAATRSLGADTCTIDALVIWRGLFLSTEATSTVQTTADPGASSIRIASRVAESEEDWNPHVEATFRALSSAATSTRLDPSIRQADAGELVDGEDCYQTFHEMGLEYGPAFRSVVEVRHKPGWALGQIVSCENSASASAWHIHPTVLDGCFQVLLKTLPKQTMPDNYVPLPGRIDRIDFRLNPGNRAWCEARLRDVSPARIVGDLRVFTEDGDLALEITGFQCQAVPRARRREAVPIDKCFYRALWRHRPLPNAAIVVETVDNIDIREIARAANESALSVWHDATRERFDNCIVYSNRFTLAYIARGMASLGINPDAVQPKDIDALVKSGKVLDRYRMHFARCARWLNGACDVGESGGKPWTVSCAMLDEDLDTLWREALAANPDWYRHFRLIEVCGRRLVEVWGGTLDPLELLFSPECAELIEYAYQDWLPSRYTNKFIQHIVSRLVSSLPANRPIRILEIGAGTGATTIHAVPALPRHRSEYWFTDLSPFFMARAEEKLRRHDFIRYCQFDVERPLEEQDIPRNAFDVVIAGHMLHATRDVSKAVRRCRDALVEGGLLVAAETCLPQPFLDMVFGMTEGWWYFLHDSARSDSPLLSRDGWLSLLEQEGFEQTCASGDERDPQAVIVGRNPRVAAQVASLSTPVEAVPPERNWVVFADRTGIGGGLAAKLRVCGLRCIEVRVGDVTEVTGADEFLLNPEDEQGATRLRDLCHENFAGDFSLLHLWALDVPATDIPHEDEVESAETMTCHCTIRLLQTFAGGGPLAPRRLMFVTRGAQVLQSESSPAAFLQAPLLGLARVAANEFAAARVRMVDIDPAGDRPAEALWSEMVADDVEEEVAWRGAHRFVPRLEPASSIVANDVARDFENSVPFKVAVQQLGNLSSLELRQTEPLPPGPNEIQVDIHWAALNFRDVLRVLSQSTQEIVEQVELGFESAGIVRMVGESVTHLKAGDRVVFCALGGLSSVLTVNAEWAARVPEGMDMLSAVSMPIAFITADFAFREVGRLRRDERVLIHSGAGGVGLAAIQLARHAGARIYTTVGSRPKRELLAKLGVDRIMNSRSLDFSDEILRETDGRGIDVVLNSLAGQATLRSLACLGPFGRFLELGKRDFLENTKIGLWPLRNNASYHAIDVTPLLDEPRDPRLVSTEAIMEKAHSGYWTPLPIQTFPAARAMEAFRFMAQGAHVGKIVVDMTQHWGRIRRTPRQVALRSNATYLVTGAFGGVGLVVAKWLAGAGAKHLMLISRSGPQTDDALAVIDELRRSGVNVQVRQCDVGDTTQVETVFSEVMEQMPPLAGIFHLAMVLDDGALVNMNRARFRKVMRPKFVGACNLHRLSRDLPLDFFVLFSSGSATFGAAGQSNYAAANAGLEGLAAYRRAHGLPATAIAWGMIGEVGYAANRPEITQYLLQFGYHEIGPSELCTALGLALGTDEPNLGVARVDWRKELQNQYRRANRQNLLSAMFDERDADVDLAPGVGRDTILAAAPELRKQLVGDLLRELTARVLGMGSEKIEADKPLAELGLDSLMAIELAGQVESQLGVAFPMRTLGGDVTLTKLTELLTRALTDSTSAGATAAPAAASTETFDSCLVELGGKPDQDVLVCLHPTGGELGAYTDLAKLLSRRYHVYGIRSRQVGGGPDEFQTFDAMVSAYVQLIDRNCPTGSLRLLGFSFGGVLAMETARLLEEKGRHVAFIALIEFEPQWFSKRTNRNPMLSAIAVELLQHLRSESHVLLEVPKDLIESKIAKAMETVVVKGPAATVSELKEWFVRSGFVFIGSRGDALSEYLTRVATHVVLAHGIESLQTVHSPLFVWKATRGLMVDDTSWETLSRGEVQLRVLEGDHFDAVAPPNCEAIAQQLESL